MIVLLYVTPIIVSNWKNKFLGVFSLLGRWSSSLVYWSVDLIYRLSRFITGNIFFAPMCLDRGVDFV